MHIAIGSDETNELTAAVVAYLSKHQHTIHVCGAFTTPNCSWSKVAHEVATLVTAKHCEQGILFCWTGTGVCMAANKVKGIRAALCLDAATAAGARRWNNANILVMSLRQTSTAIAEEILEAWFTSNVEQSEIENINYLTTIEQTN